MLEESFSFLLEFKISFEPSFKLITVFSQKKTPKKIAEITLTATKISYFAQFRIFGDIMGNLLS